MRVTSPAAGALRLLRAGGLAIAAYALASTAHLVAGGALPALPWVASTLLLTFCAAVVLTGRKLGRCATVAGLGISQLVLHQAFVFLSPTGNCLKVSGPAMHLGHEAVMACANPSMTMPAHHNSGVAMAAAHTVAAVLMGVVLARGEAALWFLTSLVWAALPTAMRVPAAEPLQRVAWRPRRPVRQLVCAGGLGRRGPPAALPAAAH
jgi:hypothetical protein